MTFRKTVIALALASTSSVAFAGGWTTAVEVDAVEANTSGDVIIHMQPGHNGACGGNDFMVPGVRQASMTRGVANPDNGWAPSSANRSIEGLRLAARRELMAAVISAGALNQRLSIWTTGCAGSTHLTDSVKITFD